MELLSKLYKNTSIEFMLETIPDLCLNNVNQSRYTVKIKLGFKIYVGREGRGTRKKYEAVWFHNQLTLKNCILSTLKFYINVELALSYCILTWNGD